MTNRLRPLIKCNSNVQKLQYRLCSDKSKNPVISITILFDSTSATTCPDPGTPLHGNRMCSTATHAYGSICSFHCDHSFQLIGNDRIICRAEGGTTSWSGIPPICKGKYLISPRKLLNCVFHYRGNPLRNQKLKEISFPSCKGTPLSNQIWE